MSEPPKSRAEAKALGARHYFTGKPCKRGHSGERFTGNGHCVECHREQQRARYADPVSGERFRARKRGYRADPVKGERLRERQRKRVRARHASNPAFRLVNSARCRIRAALDGRAKSARTLALLGVENIEQYKAYLEAQFLPGMTWENFGTTWHVDHRLPLSTFDLSSPAAQRWAFDHKNTRPMWAGENLARGARVTGADLY